MSWCFLTSLNFERGTMVKEVDPKDTSRAVAYELWMKAPNPMVTFFKTLDVTNLVKVSRKRKMKFNMLLDYCIGKGYDKSKWNSIINKTPISASSNREIGGVAPSVYLGKLEKKGSVSSSDLDSYVETHWIDHNLLRNNEFQNFIIDRAKKLLGAIEAATGRTISGKNSDEVQQMFGALLN